MNIYIASQKRNFELPDHLDKGNSIYFPESCMTTHDLLHTSRPKDFHVITDSHLLVSLYDRNEVFYFNQETKEWENPDFQTYGCSYSLILSELWDYNNSIPQAVINGETTNVMGRKILKQK